MKKFFISLSVTTLFCLSAHAASCIKSGYTQADIIALNTSYEAQQAKLIQERDYAIAHTSGESAEEKNAQVYEILLKYNADRKAADEAYRTAFDSMTFSCR